MKTPKALYASARMIYHPELSSCPQCGGPIALANYLLWDKTIQTLDAVLSVASRPGACADPTCPGASMRLRSAAGQQVALPHTSYGLDVLVRIGWARQAHHATFGDIQAALAPQVAISASHVRHSITRSFSRCWPVTNSNRASAWPRQPSSLVGWCSRSMGSPQKAVSRNSGVCANSSPGWCCVAAGSAARIKPRLRPSSYRCAPWRCPSARL